MSSEMLRRLFYRKPLALLREEIRCESRLRRALGPLQLTSMGIGAIIGTGIFVLIGVATHSAGPVITLSFVVAGLACVLAALCYAEFASMVPVTGSAYTYAYATLGELFAWIIGWDLILEYGIGAATVAHGWSKYFQDLISIFGLNLPHALMTAPFDYDPAIGKLIATHTLIDLPAVFISLIVTAVLVVGIKESARFNAAVVVVKLLVVLFVIAVGAFYIDPKNWHPFAPFGFGGIRIFGHTVFGQAGVGGEPLGMLAGAATMFYAYIGFDSVSTQSEEARNPQRDVPIAIIASLLICTVLYIAVAAVLTGMIPAHRIDIDAPIANAFAQKGLPWAEFLIAVGAMAGITSVLLVMMLGQSRILLAMARDGLIPEGFFGAVHSRFRTPWKSTLLMGAFVSLLSGFLPLRILAELVNIGTLLAFVIVCSAVLVMRRSHPEVHRPFRVPFVPVTPVLGILVCLLLMFSLASENWLRLGLWLIVGLAIYFLYGRRHSLAAKAAGETPELESPLAPEVCPEPVLVESLDPPSGRKSRWR